MEFYNKIQFKNEYLFIDLRSTKKCNIISIKNGLNITCKSDIEKYNVNKVIKNRWPPVLEIIFYCDKINKEVYKLMHHVINHLQIKLPAFIFSELDQFITEYGFIFKCNYNFPSEIIKNKIYLGNIGHASSYNILKILNITHIINCSFSIANYFKNTSKIEYKQLPINDFKTQSINKYFVESIYFINKALNDNVKNKVRCFYIS